MQSATINVRLAHDLKQNGDKVLARTGTSISELVRELYRYMEREQEVPKLLMGEQPTGNERNILTKKRQEALTSITGLLDGEIDLDEMKRERLQKQLHLEVRT
jgi:antitoxin component of RelBE/YafQ-DinJ toxin-antitoxin module